MFCENCGTELEEGQVCPKCSAQSAAVNIQSRKESSVPNILFFILDVLLFGAIVFVMMSSSASYSAYASEDEEAAAVTTEVSNEAQTLESDVRITVTADGESKSSTVQAGEDLESQAQAGEFIFPDSDKRYLDEDEIYSLNESTMRIARNEIYARHGRRFSDPELQEYFDNQPWYTGLYDPQEFDDMGNSIFNEYEYQNKTLIADIEKELGYK